MFFNTFLLVVAITGLILFAYGLKNEQKLSAFFGTIILLVPLIYLTIGIEFIPMTPAIGLLIIYYFPSAGEEKHKHRRLRRISAPLRVFSIKTLLNPHNFYLKRLKHKFEPLNAI